MNIVVLAGGLSTERDVSLITGSQVCKALRQKGHRAVLLDVFLGYEKENLNAKDVFLQDDFGTDMAAAIQTRDPDLAKIKSLRKDASCFLGPNVIEICKAADIVYMALHGAEGENGKIQATFDILGITYTGSGYLGSALAMNKEMTKKILASEGIPVPGGFCVTKEKIFPVPSNGVAFPCVVKPCCGGSSVGVSMASNQEEYEKALEEGFRYEEELLVENCIKGREFSVGVIDGESLPIIEIIPKAGFYDYETKYQPGMATDVCPAELSEEFTEKMQTYAVEVYKALKLDSYARIDFLMDENNQMYCLEANTLPGMTPTSLLPQEAKVLGIGYGDLCELIIDKAFEKSPEYKKKNSKMHGMTLKNMVEACEGRYYGNEEYLNEEITAITIDSRTVSKGCAFVAIKGNRVDGNDFVEKAYEDGALCCISEKEPEDLSKPYIVVKSCYAALKALATFYRSVCNTKIIGITGSVGKTTTKEMIASVLSEKFTTLKTMGNFNNEVGVPLTLFRLRPKHQVAVVEMGISDFGEMTRLSKIVKPDCCVITNIGQCHLENLGDRDGVLKAKTEIFSYMKPDGYIYLNGDDDKLAGVTVENAEQIRFFGNGSNAAVRAENVINNGLDGTEMDVIVREEKFHITVPVPGEHMVRNALAAISVGLDFGMTMEQIQRGILKFEPLGGHGSVVHTNKFTILDDCYNANPASMRAGIDVVSQVPGRKVAVLGDMFELGRDEEKLHYEIGQYIGEKALDVLVCIGKLGQKYKEGAMEKNANSAIHYFATVEEAMEGLSGILQEKDAILIKASHGMHFEKIVDKLKQM